MVGQTRSQPLPSECQPWPHDFPTDPRPQGTASTAGPSCQVITGQLSISPCWSGGRGAADGDTGVSLQLSPQSKQTSQPSPPGLSTGTGWACVSSTSRKLGKSPSPTASPLATPEAPVISGVTPGPPAHRSSCLPLPPLLSPQLMVPHTPAVAHAPALILGAASEDPTGRNRLLTPRQSPPQALCTAMPETGFPTAGWQRPHFPEAHLILVMIKPAE